MATYEQKPKQVTLPKPNYITVFMSGLIIGALLVGITGYIHYQKDITDNYCKIYFTNIGGFVFHKNKIYHLDGLQDLVNDIKSKK